MDPNVKIRYRADQPGQDPGPQFNRGNYKDRFMQAAPETEAAITEFLRKEFRRNLADYEAEEERRAQRTFQWDIALFYLAISVITFAILALAGFGLASLMGNR